MTYPVRASLSDALTIYMNTDLNSKMNELNTEVIAYLKKLMAAIKPMGSCIDKNTAFLNKNKNLKTVPRDLMESYNREMRKALDEVLKETKSLVENIEIPNRM